MRLTFFRISLNFYQSMFEASFGVMVCGTDTLTLFPIRQYLSLIIKSYNELPSRPSSVVTCSTHYNNLKMTLMFPCPYSYCCASISFHFLLKKPYRMFYLLLPLCLYVTYVYVPMFVNNTGNNVCGDL